MRTKRFGTDTISAVFKDSEAAHDWAKRKRYNLASCGYCYYVVDAKWGVGQLVCGGDAMSMKRKTEIAFSWTCPNCGSAQHDSVNPELGPFLNLTCGECSHTFDDATLDAASVIAWEKARQLAEQAGEATP